MAHPVVALVEDDSATITVITDLLITEGFLTFHWRQGNGAHELIKERQPQAVILDIRLEYQRAGSDVLDRLRDDPATRAIPVMICSSDAPFLATQAGRHLVMQKPVEPRALLSLIATVVGPPPPKPTSKRRERDQSA